jgi:hypothetical protein
VLLFGPNQETKVAEALNIDIHTLLDWKAEHPELNQALMRGGAQAAAEVAHSVFKIANGHRVEAVKIFMPAGRKSRSTRRIKSTILLTGRWVCRSWRGAILSGESGRRST